MIIALQLDILAHHGGKAREIGFLHPGIHHQVEIALAGPVGRAADKEVVGDGTLIGEQDGVAQPAGLEHANRARDHRFGAPGKLGKALIGRVRPHARPEAETRRPHMRDIEEAGMGARPQMLGLHALLVLHGHFIAGKGHQFRAERRMQLIQRRAHQIVIVGLGHGTIQSKRARQTGAPSSCPRCLGA